MCLPLIESPLSNYHGGRRCFEFLANPPEVMPGLFHPDGSHDRRFPCFERPVLPCPTCTFRSFVKQVRASALSTSEQGFLNAAFGGFLTGTKPPGAMHALLAAITPNAIHEDRLPRRYDGDRTLPHGRYYTVCKNAEGNDGGTLGRELKFYEDAHIADAHIEIYDPVVPTQRDMISRLGMDASARGRLVANIVPFAQPLNIEVPKGFHLSLSVEIQEVCVDGVLDLRRPAALDWLLRTIPKLHIILNDRGEGKACFPFRKELTAIGQLLPSLIDQQRGGGNFDKLVGLYLRQIGVSGLVFPSARNDAFTHCVDGEPDDFHGWSFVDYRNAPQQEIVAFIELRPEWPWTLMIEGGDDNTPCPAAFADEFKIVMTEGFPSKNGGFAFRGLEQRIEGYQMMDSLEGAIRFRLRNLDDEQIMELKTFSVSLGAQDCANFSAMVLWSLLGLARARNDLESFIRNQLSGHPLVSLLIRCSNPPPLDEEQRLTHSRAFYSLFRGPSQAPAS